MSSDQDPARRVRDEFAETGVSQSAAAAPGEQAGDVIDRYKLLQEIGEGGMGTVWMAEQREPVTRQVALKIIKLGMDTKEVVVRFEAERQALALMDHPNIAKVLDGGATDNGRPFFVMELVRGVPITQYCDEQKLGLRARLELFTKVCEAIQHAHHKGVIHRDIKPSNVMVTMHDGVPVPKVIDFGIAKATSVELTQKTLFTQYGNMIGTPEYMAPEQAEMSGLDIDTRADVYSLGVLLYELLTGSKPFDITKVLERGYQELLRTIREEEPAKPSTRVSTLGEKTPIAKAHANVGKLSSRLRGDLDWIVMRALEKDRTRRYETANGFAADVSRYLQGDPVHAAPPSSTYRLKKFLARRRKAVVVAATIAILVVSGGVGTGVGWWESHKANVALTEANGEKTRALALEVKQRRRAEAAEQAERTRANELELVTQYQASQLASVDGVQMGARLRELLLADAPADRRDALAAQLRGIEFTQVALDSIESQILMPSLEVVRSQFARQHGVRARLLLTIADALVGVSRPARAMPILQEVIAISDSHEELPAELGLNARLTRARVLSSTARFDEGLPIATSALQRCEDELGSCVTTAYANYVLGSMHNMRLDHAAGRPYLEKSIAMLAEHGETLAQTSFDARRMLANGLLALGDTDAGIAKHRENLALAESGGPDLAGSVTRCRAALGFGLLRVFRYAESIPFLRQALADDERVLGSRSSSAVLSASNLGHALIKNGQLDEAQRLLDGALENALRLELPNSSLVRTVEQKIAWLKEARGDEQAIPAFAERAVESVRDLDSNEVIVALLNTGLQALERREFDDALSAYEEALAKARRQVGKSHPYTFEALRRIGVIHRQTGALVKAERFMEEALQVATDTWGDHHANTLSAINSLSVVFQSQGKHDKALVLARRFYDGSVKALGATNIRTLIARMNRAICRVRVGRIEDAVEEMRATRDAVIEHHGRKHPYTLRCAQTLINTMLQQNRDREGLAIADETLEAWPDAGIKERMDWLEVRSLQALLRLELGDKGGVVLMRRLIEDERKYRSEVIPMRLAQLGNIALDHGWAEESLTATNELLEMRRESWGGDWRHHNTLVMIGMARGLQGDFAAEEAGVLASVERVQAAVGKGNPAPRPVHVRNCMKRVVQFYDAWHAADPSVGADAKSATWQERIRAMR